jgi:HEAT repeat protein
MRDGVTFLLALIAMAPQSTVVATTPSQNLAGQPEPVAETRKLLADTKAQVRLRAALALAPLPDAEAIGVLIELLAELAPDERRQAEQTLQLLAGDWAPNPQVAGEDELSRKIRRAAWAAWWKTMDGPALLAAFRQRTLSKEELAAARALIQQLGDKSVAARDRAVAALVAQGTKVIGLLRDAAKNSDVEQARRAGFCLQQIALKEAKDKLPLAAPRLLAARQPAGASAALLAYLAFADDRVMKDEIGKALVSLARAADKVDPALVEGLDDQLPVRRVMAAATLASTGGPAYLAAVRKLLRDVDSEVRLHVAEALVSAHDKEAVPTLIELLAEFPRAQLGDAEDLLYRLAGAKSPTVPWGVDDAATRKTFRAAWQAWWKEHGAALNMAELDKTRPGGLTLVVEKVGRGAVGAGFDTRLVALDRNGQARWQIDNLKNVYDFQLLPGDRLLLAEYSARRITERDFKGNVLWEVGDLPGSPINVQRLADGNTFIATFGPINLNTPLAEVDSAGKTVASFSVPGVAAKPNLAHQLIAARKTADGKMVCLMFDTSCIWLDATGKELKRFLLPLTKGVPAFFKGIDVTPNGNVLLSHVDGTVVECDMDGKIVWEAKAAGFRPSRLANGNTLVVSPGGGVVELDPAGQRVWSYDPPAGYEVLRARRQ